MATPTWLKPKFSDLETCVKVTENVATNSGGDASEEEFAHIVDVSPTSSYFNLRLNSIRAYGFLDYREGRVKLTSLGEKVATPTDAQERASALLAAMMNFSVFKKVTERHRGRSEPEKKFVENALANEGNIKKEEASKWADCFLMSGRFAGLFKPSSFLDSGIKVAQTFTVPIEARDEVAQSAEVPPGWLTYPVPVPGGMARIIVPSNLSRPAWDKLRKLLEAIEPAKDGEQMQ
jgi:hypothetical protein